MSSSESVCESTRRRRGVETPEKKKLIRGESKLKLESRQQKYRGEWEQDSMFKGWIRPVVGVPNKAYCKACRWETVAKLSNLREHSNTEKHLKSVKGLVHGQRTLFQCNSQPSRNVHADANTSIKRAEILWAGLIANNINRR